MGHNGAHPQKCHRETQKGTQPQYAPSPVIISQGFPHPYPICIPADLEVKGSEFTGAFSSQMRLQLPGQQGTLAPRRGLADSFLCFRALLCHLSLLTGPERDSVQLKVMQLPSGRQGSGPRHGPTGWCAPHQIPFAEAAEAEDEAQCFITQCCGASGPGQQESPMRLELMGRRTWRLVLNLRTSAGHLTTLLCCLCVHAHSLGPLLFLPTSWWQQGQR